MVPKFNPRARITDEPNRLADIGGTPAYVRDNGLSEDDLESLENFCRHLYAQPRTPFNMEKVL